MVVGTSRRSFVTGRESAEGVSARKNLLAAILALLSSARSDSRRKMLSGRSDFPNGIGQLAIKPRQRLAIFEVWLLAKTEIARILERNDASLEEAGSGAVVCFTIRGHELAAPKLSNFNVRPKSAEAKVSNFANELKTHGPRGKVSNFNVQPQQQAHGSVRPSQSRAVRLKKAGFFMFMQCDASGMITNSLCGSRACRWGP